MLHPFVFVLPYQYSQTRDDSRHYNQSGQSGDEGQYQSDQYRDDNQHHNQPDQPRDGRQYQSDQHREDSQHQNQSGHSTDDKQYQSNQHGDGNQYQNSHWNSPGNTQGYPDYPNNQGHRNNDASHNSNGAAGLYYSIPPHNLPSNPVGGQYGNHSHVTVPSSINLPQFGYQHVMPNLHFAHNFPHHEGVAHG